MSTPAEAALERMAAALAECQQIEDTFGSDRAAWPAGQVERWERMAAAARAADADAEAALARAEKIEAIREAAKDPKSVERIEAPSPFGSRRRDPWEDLTEHTLRSEAPEGWVARGHDVVGEVTGITTTARNVLAEAIDKESDAARAIVVRANPHYLTAFEKILHNPERGMFTLTPAELGAVSAVEAVRASLSTNTGTAGWAIPLSLDPNLAVLTNTGTANPFRAISAVRQTASSPARVLSSAGVTGEWLSEATEAADASPVFAKTDVTLFKAAAWISAAVEILEDAGSSIVGALPMLLADARDRLEVAAFCTGNGTSAPAGVVTRVAATTASRIAATTASTFGAITEVFKVWDGLSARTRSSNPAWIAHNSTISKIRQFSTATNTAAWWASLGDGTPERLIGAPIYEVSAMDSAVTTGSNLLLAGSFSTAFCIVDHVMGASLEYVPNILGGNQRPTYQRGWQYHHRVGSEVLDASAFRVLQL